MKRRDHILLFFLMIISLFCFCSCLKEDPPIYSKPEEELEIIPCKTIDDVLNQALVD